MGSQGLGTSGGAVDGEKLLAVVNPGHRASLVPIRCALSFMFTWVR